MILRSIPIPGFRGVPEAIGLALTLPAAAIALRATQPGGDLRLTDLRDQSEIGEMAVLVPRVVPSAREHHEHRAATLECATTPLSARQAKAHSGREAGVATNPPIRQNKSNTRKLDPSAREPRK